MTTFRVALRSLNGGLSHQSHKTHLLRSLSTWENFGNGPIDRQTDDSYESAKEFERRLFGESSHSNSKTDAIFEKLGNFPNNQQTHDSYKSAKEYERRIFGESSHSNSKTDAFFERLNQIEKNRDRYTSRPEMLDDLDESFDTLTDGMDGKLKNAARYFEIDDDEVEEDGYAFRYDASYTHDLTYDIKDLDLTKPAASKLPKFDEFTVTTEEVLRKADFRNVRFLANFITEAGIIIKRSQTGISAKAQRKVAREIKIARAFGLMPFTTMGTKSFVFGKTMESLDEDYLHESYDTRMGTYMEGSESFVA